jgi:hypothetical protein
MNSRSRVNLIVDDQNRLITIRPIGVLPKSELLAQVYEGYAKLKAPWTYRRARDLRRWESKCDPVGETEISRHWAELTAGHDHKPFVAVVLADASDHLRQPRVSPGCPDEIVCDFTDYHEVVGWLLADDRDAHLAGLGDLPTRRRGPDQILIE